MFRTLSRPLAVTTLLLITAASGAHAQEDQLLSVARRYTFNPVRPPLLTETKGDVFGVPEKNLQSAVGQATWTTHTSQPLPALPDGTPQFLNTDKVFKFVRRMRWVLQGSVERYATDKEVTIKVTQGWSKTEKETMEKLLEADAKFPLFKIISAEVKASLKLTTDVTNEWHEETTKDEKRIFKANTTYCVWQMYDQLDLVVETKISTDKSDLPASGEHTRTEAPFRYAVRLYEDSAPDKDGRILASAVASFRSVSFTTVGAPRAIE